MMVPLFLNLGSGEIFLIVLVILMFFGSNSIPTLARSLGKGMREFRDAASGLQREIQNSVDEIRDSVDLSQEIREVNEAARNLTSGVQEGLDNLKENTDINKALNESEKKENTTPPSDQLTTTDTTTTTENPEQTTDTTPEITSSTDIPTDDAPPQGPPNSVKRN